MIEQADSAIRFLFVDRAVRGVWVRLQKSFTDVLAGQDYNLFAKTLLGESLAASVLLSRTIKLQGRLALHARGEGFLRLLVAECTQDAGIRGVLEFSDGSAHDINETLSLRECLGDGYLAVTLLPDDGDNYQGIVPLQGERLQNCLAEYFVQSEQLATAMWLHCDGEQAVGLLLQALPAGGGDSEHDDWQHLHMLARTIKDEELLQLSCEEVLHRLFHEEHVQLFAPESVRFQCTCSEGRSRNALAMLGRDELQKIYTERPAITVDCQFCGRQYSYSAADMAEVLGAPPALLQ